MPSPRTRQGGALLATLLTLVTTPGASTSAASGPAAGSVGHGSLSNAAEAITAGRELIQQARQNSDKGLLAKAEQAFQRAIDLEPGRADGYVGLASLALSRHHFQQALELGRTAQELAPASSQPLGAVFDALVELGRYDEARDAIEAMLRIRPDLSSLSRLSYFHELHGRLDLAIEAMEQAIVAGSSDVEHVTFARTVLGHLWLLEGDFGRARQVFDDALAAIPGYVPALVGSARFAAATDDWAAAQGLLEEALEAQQEPVVMVLLGEAQEVSGDLAGAEDTYRQAVVTEAAHRATGEAPEAFGSVLEADHGDPALALTLAQLAYDHAPSIGTADAMAWALFKIGDLQSAQEHADEALRTDTVDPVILYHAGVIAAANGQRDRAAGLLRASLSRSAAGPLRLRAEVGAALETNAGA